MTKQWYGQCQVAGLPPFDKSLEEHVKGVMRSYWEAYKRMFPSPPDFTNTIDRLHDCEIISAKLVDNDYVIITDNGQWGMEGTTEILCKNATVIKQDFNHQELGWYCHELYLTEKGYELHVLFFEYGSSELYDLILTCENIEIRKEK